MISINNLRGKNLSRGAGTVELVILLLPILFLLIVGADFARLMHALVSLDSAARVGATTGAQFLNQTDEDGSPIYFADSADGDITFPEDDSDKDIFDYIRQATKDDAEPYPVEDDDVTITFWCRCPEYDPSFRTGEANDGESSELVPGCTVNDVIRNCQSRPPEILLQVKVASSFDPILGGRWVFPDVQNFSRSALISAR